LLSDANVPVRLTAQQRAMYRSQQLTTNCIAAKRCLRHYFKLIWESPTTEDTNFHCHWCSFPFKTRIEWPPGWPQYSRQHQSFSAHWAGWSDEKTDSTFPAFSFRIVDFAVQFLFLVFIPREETFEPKLTVAWFACTNHNSLPAHCNQWDCFILYRS